MKVVSISCSPRINGNCDTLIEEVIRGINDSYSDIEIDKYKLSNLHINGCMACQSCKKSTGCIQRDDMQRVYKDINDLDVLIFASPIYMGYITGNGKNFMDRMYAFHKGHYEVSLPKGKKVILILTQGHLREDAYRRVADDLTNFFNGLGMEVVGRIIAAGANNKDGLKDEILSIAYDMGKKI